MLPNKKRQVRLRRTKLRKTDRMLSLLRREVKEPSREGKYRRGWKGKGMLEAVGKVSAGNEALQGKIESKKEEVKGEAEKTEEKITPMEDYEGVKKVIQELKIKVGIPAEKEVSKSYLDYACIYRGIKLTPHQRDAIKVYFQKYDKV